MLQEKKEFGLAHPRDRYLAVFEFNLSDLEWLQNLIPYSDGFFVDIGEAIAWILKSKAMRADEKEG